MSSIVTAPALHLRRDEEPAEACEAALSLKEVAWWARRSESDPFAARKLIHLEA